MKIAIYARSANNNDIMIQVENCMRYIINWRPRARIKLFTEIVDGIQSLENCVELQKLINESICLDAIVVSNPLCFFPHIMDESFAVYKKIGGHKIHYAINP